MSNESVKKRKRSKRLSKSEEEKRVMILKPLLNEWVCVKNKYEENEYYFLKHVLVNENKYSRIRQILISNHAEESGIYEIADYDVSYVFDAEVGEKKVELKITKYDLVYGLYSENDFAKNSQELISRIISEGYLSYEQYKRMKKDKMFPQECSEIILNFVKNNRNTKELLRKEVN